MTIKLPCGISEKPVANIHQTINCDKCGLWIHIKRNRINKQTYIYLMREKSHWYRMLCTKTFLPSSVLMNLNKEASENNSNLLIYQNQQSLVLRTSLNLLILKATLLNTLQSKIWILLSVTLAALFPCFTWTLTRCPFTLMNWKGSYQNQKTTFK